MGENIWKWCDRQGIKIYMQLNTFKRNQKMDKDLNKIFPKENEMAQKKIIHKLLRNAKLQWSITSPQAGLNNTYA